MDFRPDLGVQIQEAVSRGGVMRQLLASAAIAAALVGTAHAGNEDLVQLAEKVCAESLLFESVAQARATELGKELEAAEIRKELTGADADISAWSKLHGERDRVYDRRPDIDKALAAGKLLGKDCHAVKPADAETVRKFLEAEAVIVAEEERLESCRRAFADWRSTRGDGYKRDAVDRWIGSTQTGCTKADVLKALGHDAYLYE